MSQLASQRVRKTGGANVEGDIFGRGFASRLRASTLTRLLVGCVLALWVNAASFAATLVLDFDTSFGSVPADGPTPWLRAIFDDGGIPGSVTLTMLVSATVGAADVTQVYFNLDPVFDPVSLNLTRIGGNGPSAARTSIGLGSDSFKAGGDGFYDIWFDLPPPGNRFEAGEALVYNITGIASLTANSFNFFSTPGNDGNPGPFLAAAHVLSTGLLGEDSDWIAPEPPGGVVPVPAGIWMFGSALGLLGWMRRSMVRMAEP
jgi:hypothetical protein